MLRKGDFYAIVDDRLYCQKHYDRVQQNVPPPPPPQPPYPTPPNQANQPPPPPLGFPPHHPMQQLAMGPQDDPMFPYLPGGGGGADYPHPHFEPGWFPPPPPGSEYMPGMGPGGMHGHPHGHGPPGAEFSPFENNNEPKKKRPGRKRRPKVNAEAAAFAAMNGYSGSVEGAYPPGMDGGAAGKAKRARTSFKHHQLRIMKAHFQINQNPDSRELKMLSQKTNLDKKVLQVSRSPHFVFLCNMVKCLGSHILIFLSSGMVSKCASQVAQDKGSGRKRRDCSARTSLDGFLR